MPGPRPTPTPLKVIRGNPGQRPIRAEPALAASPQVPKAPAHLDGFARAEWNRIAVELHRLRLLTVVDLQPLAAYCQAYDRWRTAEESLAAVAPAIPCMVL